MDLGVLAQRVAEFIMNDLSGEASTSPDVISRIDKLGGKGIASWILSSMHVLRVLGNEAGREKNGRRPPTVEETDLTISLLYMHRLWSFWARWRRNA